MTKTDTPGGASVRRTIEEAPEDSATFEQDEACNHADSLGLINPFGLPVIVQALLKQEQAPGKNGKWALCQIFNGWGGFATRPVFVRFTHHNGMDGVPRDGYRSEMECWLRFGNGCIA